MKKSILGFSALAAALSMSMTSCQNEEFASVSSGDEFENVHVIATVTGPFQSRTSKPMTANGLECSWEENDKVVVFSENGEDNLGVLTLETGAGEKDATFSGTLRVRPSDTKVNIYYLGRNKTDGFDNLMIDETFNIDLQNGDNNSITEYDIMYSAAEMKRLGDGSASLNFGLNSIVSFAHFYAHLPEGVVPANNETITVSGQNVFNQFTLNFANAAITNTVAGPITVNPVWETGASNEFDFFMAVLPGENVQTDFNITIGEKTYRASLDARTYNANKIFSGGKIEGKDVYFSEKGEWTVTYIKYIDDNPKQTVTKNGYGPSMTFQIVRDPVKAGYKFMGWSDEENGTVNPAYTYNAPLTLTRPNTEKTLYAVWEEEWHFTTYTLNYKDGATETQYYNSQCTTPWIFYCNSDDYNVPEGYTLLGWADEEGATVAKYVDGDQISTGGKDIQTKTVYPVLKKKSSEGTITAPGSTGTGY